MTKKRYSPLPPRPGDDERFYFILRRMTQDAGASVFDSFFEGVTCWSDSGRAHIILEPQPIKQMAVVLAHEVGHQFKMVRAKHGILTLKYSPNHDEVEADRRGEQMRRMLDRSFSRRRSGGS